MSTLKQIFSSCRQLVRSLEKIKTLLDEIYAFDDPYELSKLLDKLNRQLEDTGAYVGIISKILAAIQKLVMQNPKLSGLQTKRNTAEVLRNGLIAKNKALKEILPKLDLTIERFLELQMESKIETDKAKKKAVQAMATSTWNNLAGEKIDSAKELVDSMVKDATNLAALEQTILQDLRKGYG